MDSSYNERQPLKKNCWLLWDTKTWICLTTLNDRIADRCCRLYDTFSALKLFRWLFWSHILPENCRKTLGLVALVCQIFKNIIKYYLIKLLFQGSGVQLFLISHVAKNLLSETKHNHWFKNVQKYDLTFRCAIRLLYQGSKVWLFWLHMPPKIWQVRINIKG